MERAIQLDNIFSTTDSVRLSISCGCLVLTDLSISRKSSARRTLVAYSMLPINVTTNSEATLTLIKRKGSVSDELYATHSRQAQQSKSEKHLLVADAERLLRFERVDERQQEMFVANQLFELHHGRIVVGARSGQTPLQVQISRRRRRRRREKRFR